MTMLGLTIPCAPGKPFGPKDVRPIYVFDGNDRTGAAICSYRCPHCNGQFFRSKVCEGHMGMIMNKPASCPVLLEQDEKRRGESRSHNREMRAAAGENEPEPAPQIEWWKQSAAARQIYAESERAKLSDELVEIREREKLNKQDWEWF